MNSLRSSLVLYLLLAWFGCGAITTLAGFTGYLYPLLSWLLMLPVLLLSWLLLDSAFSLKRLLTSRQWTDSALMIALLFIWLLHLTGVFVPETGFDAVWYHLPIVDQFSELHRIQYLPDYYQSVNPLFSDLIFLLGFQLAGELGAKMVAYGLALTLAIVSYHLARGYLNRFWALLFVIQVSLMQVVTWQASSFYVDIAKSVWELGSLYLLCRTQIHLSANKKLVLSALFFGASLATKQFSLILLPVMLLIVYLNKKNWRVASYWLLVTLLIACPFYYFSWQTTGDPFYAVNLHLAKLQEISGTDSVSSHLWRKLLNLPSALWFLVFVARDYISPLLLLLLPFGGWQMLSWWRNERRWNIELVSLFLFSIGQFCLWWLVPPISTRYALSGFIIGVLLLMVATVRWLEKNSQWKNSVVVGILIVSSFLLLPRLVVGQRNTKHIVSGQSTAEYLQQFMDGNIDYHLLNWHQRRGRE